MVRHAAANNDLSGSFFPTIPQWVEHIANSKLVITTSFHGMVFCIINNVNFILLPNTGKAQGMNVRIDSLLGLIGLRDHVMNDFDREKLDSILNKKVDWERINTIIQSKRDKSLTFLKESLG